MPPPQTRYAKSGDLSIAYQVFGNGPPDLVVIPGFVSHLEFCWEHPPYERFMRRLASFARVIVYDKRGCGLSDPIERSTTLEERMDDTRAVMEAAGSERAALLGISEGSSIAALFAASYPERTQALVVFGALPKGTASDDFPHAMVRDAWELSIASVREAWGEGHTMMSLAPSGMEDEAFVAWWKRFERLAASPRVAMTALELNAAIDIRAILPTIGAPTLILHRSGDVLPIEGARWMADQIPGARFIELPGDDHWPWGTDPDPVVDEIDEFLTGQHHPGEVDRVLSAVLFTDIVGSTERATEIGDRRWRDLLDRHDRAVRGELQRYRGREIKSTGDGFLAIFDGPARAIHCACAVRDDLAEIGMPVRAGVHTGECELRSGDVGGIAVHIGARVAACAGPGEVLVSSTVKDLVVGSGLAFEDRGRHVLKGAPGEWRLFAVEDAGAH